MGFRFVYLCVVFWWGGVCTTRRGQGHTRSIVHRSTHPNRRTKTHRVSRKKLSRATCRVWYSTRRVGAAAAGAAGSAIVPLLPRPSTISRQPVDQSVTGCLLRLAVVVLVVVWACLLLSPARPARLLLPAAPAQRGCPPVLVALPMVERGNGKRLGAAWWLVACVYACGWWSLCTRE